MQGWFFKLKVISIYVVYSLNLMAFWKWRSSSNTSSWHRALLGLQTHCSFAVVLMRYWCCTDAVRPRAPSVPRYGGVYCPLSCPTCASASRKKFLKGSCLRCFASLFHTLIYSLRSLIWPALTQLCCKVWASCAVWSLGQREEFLHFRRGDRLSKQPARPAAFHVLRVLPGNGNTIQSVTVGFFFTGGC